MPQSWQPVYGESVTVVASGTPVLPVSQPFDNTHTVIVYNSHATNELYASWQSTAAAITVANGVVIPPQSSLSLAIGVVSERVGESNALLRFDANGAATTGYVTFVQGSSS